MYVGGVVDFWDVSDGCIEARRGGAELVSVCYVRFGRERLPRNFIMGCLCCARRVRVAFMVGYGEVAIVPTSSVVLDSSCIAW